MVEGSHIDVKLFVLIGRMVSGAFVEDGDGVVRAAEALVLTGAVAEILVSTDADVATEVDPEAEVVKPVADTVTLALSEERALDGEAVAVDEAEAMLVEPDRLEVGRDVSVMFAVLLPEAERVGLAIELDVIKLPLSVTFPEEVGRVMDPEAEVIPEADVEIPVGVVVGALTELEAEVVTPVPEAEVEIPVPEGVVTPVPDAEVV